MAVSLWGCSGTNSEAPPFKDGSHPADWITAHGVWITTKGADVCRSCHGDKLEGGITGVTCVKCHVETLDFDFNGMSRIGHVNSFLNLPPQGILTRQETFTGQPAVQTVTIPEHARIAMMFPRKGNSVTYGYEYCTGCHNLGASERSLPANLFVRDGNPVNASLGCSNNNAECHNNGAAHGSSTWITHHMLTNPQNATECYTCHKNTDPLASTQPSCFNGSMVQIGGASAGVACHPSGVDGPAQGVITPSSFQHPEATWSSPSMHGLAAKKYPRNVTSGMTGCLECHDGDLPFVSSCATVNCHGNAAPHPNNWEQSPSVGRSHQTVSPANASACSRCHRIGQAVDPTKPFRFTELPTAGCFNNTLCHGQKTPHPTGWDASASHGQAALQPGQTDPDKAEIWGYNNCERCHGPAFSGQTEAPTCTNLITCHKGATAHPDPGRDLTWKDTTHKTLSGLSDPLRAGVADTCASCHRDFNKNRLETNGSAVGCYNNTLCHGTVPF